MPDLWETAPSEADENQFQIQLAIPSGQRSENVQRLRNEFAILSKRSGRTPRLPRASSVTTSWSKYQDLLLRDLS